MGTDVDEDDVVFFDKNDPVNVSIWFDPESEMFIASATLSSSSEKICEGEGEDLEGALDYVSDILLKMCADPKLFNDRLKNMVLNIGKSKPSNVKRLR